MCGRYAFAEPKGLARRFGVKVTRKPPANYNVAPGQYMPVISIHEGQRSLEDMKWGLIPSWAKDSNVGYKLINARSETVFEKPAWRTAILRRRCLIPATGFYEWKRDGSAKKQPYYIKPKSLELFSFAGIWESWHDAQGKPLRSYSIITTGPNKEMSRLHDRMPVILHENDEALWLSEDDDRGLLETLMRPYQDGGLEMFEVSKDVNVVKNNDGHLILPINSK